MANCSRFILVIAFLILQTIQSVTAQPNRSSNEVQDENTGNGSSQILYQDWFDAARNRKIPVKIYLPSESAINYPVVIFSHGLGGSREAAQYLGEYWSSHGFISIHIQHIGSDKSIWEDARGQGKAKILDSLKTGANPNSFNDRVADIKFTLDELQRLNNAAGPLHGKLDLSRLAIAGHSYGAGTSLTMVGRKYFIGGQPRQFTDSRIRAAIYLCPPVELNGHSPQEVFGDIKVPGMVLTGTKDNSPIGKTTAAERRLSFDGIQSPHQYLVTFIGADHMLFNGAKLRAQLPAQKEMLAEIEKVTTAFLDAYLNHNRQARAWLDSDAARYVSGDAKFEQK